MKTFLRALLDWLAVPLLCLSWAAVAYGMAWATWYGARWLFGDHGWVRATAGPLAAFMGMFGPFIAGSAALWIGERVRRLVRAVAERCQGSRS